MPETMTKRERLNAAIRGDATDRPVWSLWRHFYDTETSPEGLANSMLGFQKANQFDFMKVNPRASYHVEDWGATFRFSGKPHLKPVSIDVPVHQASDWATIEPLPADKGVLGDHLKALKLIREGLAGEVPFIMTIFTPLAIAGRLVKSDSVLLGHMKESPSDVHKALRAITETFVNYVKAVRDVGVDGIFLATTSWATRRTTTPEQYAEFGRPYDLQVLAAANGAAFNVLHVCDEQNMLYDLSDYPVQAFNWAATSPSNPTIADAKQKIDRLLIAGVSQQALVTDSPDQALAEARKAREQGGDRHWGLGPNCSIPTESRQADIDAVKQFITKS